MTYVRPPFRHPALPRNDLGDTVDYYEGSPVVAFCAGCGLISVTKMTMAMTTMIIRIHALTVGRELNKIASNVANGRNIAGVHWRSDATESLKLGEALAISILKDQRRCYNEQFAGFSLTKFDRTTITVL